MNRALETAVIDAAVALVADWEQPTRSRLLSHTAALRSDLTVAVQAYEAGRDPQPDGAA